jgi:hypothetical protein
VLLGRFDRDTYWTVEKTNACLIRNRFSLYNVIFHASRVRDKAVVYYKPGTLCHLSHVDSIKLLKNGNRCLVNISRRMSPSVRVGTGVVQDFCSNSFFTQLSTADLSRNLLF